jgi:enoyl-CoA hydratase/carnithine racemase
MAHLALTTVEHGIVTLTLNRPEARNALSLALIEAMNDAMDDLERAAAAGMIRVLILSGAGRVFCAGMDLKGVLSDAAAMGRMLHGLSRFLRRIRRVPIPTIACVQGAAVGGGCGLMVVADLAITHADAKVGYPEVSLGVCPAVVAPWLMKKIGPGRARAMLLTGGTIGGREALECGLVDQLAEREALEGHARELARKLAGGGASALAVTKRWLNELDGSMDEAAYDRAAELSAEVIAGPEAQARLRSILGA